MSEQSGGRQHASALTPSHPMTDDGWAAHLLDDRAVRPQHHVGHQQRGSHIGHQPALRLPEGRVWGGKQCQGGAAGRMERVHRRKRGEASPPVPQLCAPLPASSLLTIAATSLCEGCARWQSATSRPAVLSLSSHRCPTDWCRSSLVSPQRQQPRDASIEWVVNKSDVYTAGPQATPLAIGSRTAIAARGHPYRGLVS